MVHNDSLRESALAMSDTPTPGELRFDYIKGNHFRVVHADGVFGGVTHHSKVWATVWSERGAIPTHAVFTVTSEGVLEEDLQRRTVRNATIREAEVCLVMDLGLARSLRQWLDDKITAIEKHQGSEPGSPTSITRTQHD